MKFVNSDGEIFVNLILNLENNLINEPVIFCPTVTNNESLIKEIKNQIEEEIIKFGKNFIDDNIMRDEIKRNVKKFVNKNIGLKPLTYVEIVRI